MKALQIAALTAAIVNVLITILVLWRDFRAKTSAPYAIWGMSLTIWNVSAYFLLGDLSFEAALIWNRILMLGVVFLPLGLLHLCMTLTGFHHRRFIAILGAIHVAMALTLLTPWFIQGVRPLALGHWGVPGPVFYVYLVLYTLESAAIILLLSHARKTAGKFDRTKFSLMLASSVALIVFGTNDMLPLFNQDKYPLLHVNFVPLGNLAALFYAIVIAYSLLQHQFLDVHLTLNRAAAQAVRLIFVFGIALILALITVTFAPANSFPPFAFLAALFIVAVSTTIASIAFPRLFGSGEEVLERRIFGDRFEYEDRVRAFVERMSWHTSFERLLDDLHELLTHSFRLRSYHIILRDETQHSFATVRSYPDDPVREFSGKADSPVFKFFEASSSQFLALNPHYARPGERPLARFARHQLRDFAAEFCFPLRSHDDQFGIFITGPKSDDKDYTATDIQLLTDLVKNLSVTANQIRLKSQIIQAQEFDLLGRMSKGMAHDLNNLLTPVWTLLQLARESGNTQPVDDELLPVALRNIASMRAYIREALFFSQNSRPDMQLGRLDLVIERGVQLARASRKKEVEIIPVTPGEVLVEMDEVLIQRLIANLISNAIDASTPRSVVRVELERLEKVENSRDWLRLRVIDTGEGIPKENLSRVLTPYFTTKDRGDENRGFGLGLSICRKIVNVHGGNLSIASQLKKGTTVQVDLPSRQTKQILPPVTSPA